MAENELRLDILGTSFSITAGEDEEYLQEIMSQFRRAVENTRQISGMKDPLKIAILAGFLLCDEINKIRLEAGEAEQRTLNLITRLDRALEDASPGES